MPDQERYVPLSERLNQDVMHDNFVPKYSALATAQPSRLVLIGVWLIFAPMALFALSTAPSLMREAPGALAAVIFLLGPSFALVISIAILTVQTKRYLEAKRQGPEPEED